MGFRSARIAPTLRSETPTPRRVRRVLPGPLSTALYASEFATIVSLLLGRFEQLQRNADDFTVSISNFLPETAVAAIESLVSCSALAAFSCLIVHFVAMRSAITRVTLPELLVYVGWGLFFFTHATINPSDLILYHLMILCFLFCLSTVNLVLPRKKKHKRRPNTYYSAFSVASTPTSQCSSFMMNSSRKSSARKSFNNTARSLDFSLMDTTPPGDDLPELQAERRPFQKEMTPFTELSGRLSGLTLDFSDTSMEHKSLFKPPSGSGMLSLAAITPKKGAGPFGSIPMDKVSNRTPQKTQSLFNAPHKNVDFSSDAFCSRSLAPPSLRRQRRSLASASESSCATSLRSNRVTFTTAAVGVLAAIGGATLLVGAYQFLSQLW